MSIAADWTEGAILIHSTKEGKSEIVESVDHLIINASADGAMDCLHLL